MATVYVMLLDEGTVVWRPVEAERVGANTFRLLGPVPDGETWEFPPDSVVNCEMREFDGGNRCLVAVAQFAVH